MSRADILVRGRQQLINAMVYDGAARRAFQELGRTSDEALCSAFPRALALHWARAAALPRDDAVLAVDSLEAQLGDFAYEGTEDTPIELSLPMLTLARIDQALFDPARLVVRIGLQGADAEGVPTEYVDLPVIRRGDGAVADLIWPETERVCGPLPLNAGARRLFVDATRGLINAEDALLSGGTLARRVLSYVTAAVAPRADLAETVAGLWQSALRDPVTGGFNAGLVPRVAAAAFDTARGRLTVRSRNPADPVLAREAPVAVPPVARAARVVPRAELEALNQQAQLHCAPAALRAVEVTDAEVRWHEPAATARLPIDAGGATAFDVAWDAAGAPRALVLGRRALRDDPVLRAWSVERDEATPVAGLPEGAQALCLLGNGLVACVHGTRLSLYDVDTQPARLRFGPVPLHRDQVDAPQSVVLAAAPSGREYMLAVLVDGQVLDHWRVTDDGYHASAEPSAGLRVYLRDAADVGGVYHMHWSPQPDGLLHLRRTVVNDEDVRVVTDHWNYDSVDRSLSAMSSFVLPSDECFPTEQGHVLMVRACNKAIRYEATTKARVIPQGVRVLGLARDGKRYAVGLERENVTEVAVAATDDADHDVVPRARGSYELGDGAPLRAVHLAEGGMLLLTDENLGFVDVPAA